jgi:hypothetical protein
VIIGNPPYLDLKLGTSYEAKGYQTIVTKNLYPLLMERCLVLWGKAAQMGVIVPVSSISTDGYATLQNLIFEFPAHFSSYDDRPSRLFDGLDHIQLTIHLIKNEKTSLPVHRVTECYRWSAAERHVLFATLEYETLSTSYLTGTLPKISRQIEHHMLDTVWSDKFPVEMSVRKTGAYEALYSRKVHNFLQALDFVPKVVDGKGKERPPSELKALKFDKRVYAEAAFGILNSSLFRWFINVFSDCRHVNKREVVGFRCNFAQLADTHGGLLTRIAKDLSKSLKRTSEVREMKFAHDTLRVQCIIPKLSKAIIDEIDTVLAKHYGFTDEELDFILNYDIKYRLGLGRNGGADDDDAIEE